ncbi:MAG TPA: PBP1A family penicillin-binding protein [Methylomirabilota bacterium]|nr:PBP1A family penicillin-binding protein [Methylomirabilota bacterium]
MRLRLRRPRRWWVTALVGILALMVVGTMASALWAFIVLPSNLPAVSQLEDFRPLEGTKVYDDNDELLTELHEERRIFVPLAQIPKPVQQAILAMEDSRFYSHFGVDPMGILRAIYQNFRQGRIAEGGSTITQQLAKVLFLTPDKSLERKLKEAFLALELERRYSKDRILELYLNHIYFGHGSYGVEAAARTYFGRSVTELSIADAALLASLPQAPGKYSPFLHPDSARRRRGLVVNRMVDVGFIKKEQGAQVNAAPIALVPPERRKTTGQYFLEYVQQALEAKYGVDMVYKGGLHVYTTLNPKMQLTAELSLREGLKTLTTRTGSPVAAKTKTARGTEEAPEGALLTIEPQTGYIKTMVGGSDFFRSEFNRATQARRQPGSAFKPFVYIAALESGLSPADLIDDSPVSYPGVNGKPWQPENYDKKFRGPTTLQRGVEESINIVTIKVLERVGIRKVVEVARRLGIQSPLNNNLTLALGSSDLSLLELTSAYGAFANQGVWMPPIAIRYVTDKQGKLLEENVPQGREALSPEVAYSITHMLRGVVERGTGVAAKALDRPIAAKTGTTNDFSNAWFVGYTPRVVTGVWVGYDRPRSLGFDETGARVAVPIWTAYMTKMLSRTPPEDFPVPERVVFATVDRDGGQLDGNVCTHPVIMAFLPGNEPRAVCR